MKMVLNDTQKLLRIIRRVEKECGVQPKSVNDDELADYYYELVKKLNNDKKMVGFKLTAH